MILEILSKKYWKEVSNLGTIEFLKKIENKGTIVNLTFEIDVLNLSLVFWIFNTLGPKIEICFKYFLDKKPKSRHTSGKGDEGSKKPKNVLA